MGNILIFVFFAVVVLGVSALTRKGIIRSNSLYSQHDQSDNSFDDDMNYNNLD